MSFSRLIKDEIARIEPSKRCCRLAEISAIVHIDGTLHIQDSSYALHTVTENAAVARMSIKLLSQLFQLKAEITVRRSVLHKSNNYVIYIGTNAKLNQALNELGILDDCFRIKYGILPRIIKKKCCAIAYLRGVFMGGGFISDPRGEHHFEITTENRGLAGDLQTVLKRFDLPAKISRRKRNYAVYLTSSESMTEFLALIGAYNALLKWEETIVVKGIRNQINRLVNCETANLNKIVDAALSQIRDITLIEEEVGLNAIPGSLQEIAGARLKHPYVSLKELGTLCRPSLSKSAVYHRFKRLHVMAESLVNKQKRSSRAAN